MMKVCQSLRPVCSTEGCRDMQASSTLIHSSSTSANIVPSTGCAGGICLCFLPSAVTVEVLSITDRSHRFKSQGLKKGSFFWVGAGLRDRSRNHPDLSFSAFVCAYWCAAEETIDLEAGVITNSSTPPPSRLIGTNGWDWSFEAVITLKEAKQIKQEKYAAETYWGGQVHIYCTNTFISPQKCKIDGEETEQ